MGSPTQSGFLSGFPTVGMAMIQGVEKLTIAPDALAGVRTVYLRGVGADATRSVFQHFRHIQQLSYLEVSPGYDTVGKYDGAQLPHVDDDLIQHVTYLKALKSLYLQNSRITDAGVIDLAKLVNLERLHIYSDGITDASLSHFASMKKLQQLTIGSANVDPNAGEKLGIDLPNTSIQIYKNTPR
jgi:Leucine-rich repeat (LRR) protein